MGIDTTDLDTNHAKSIAKKLSDRNELPFTDILSTADIEEHLSDIAYRDRVYTPDLTIFTFLSQVMGADKSCQAALAQVITHLMRQGVEAPSANTAAYCKARARLPESVLSGLAKKSAEQLEVAAPKEWLWRSRDVKLIDGATLSMPDTPENQAVYPQPTSQKKAWVTLLCALLQLFRWQRVLFLILQWALIRVKRRVSTLCYVN